MTILLIFHVNQRTHQLTPADGGWKRPIKGRHFRRRGGSPALARRGVADAGRASWEEEYLMAWRRSSGPTLRNSLRAIQAEL